MAAGSDLAIMASLESTSQWERAPYTESTAIQWTLLVLWVGIIVYRIKVWLLPNEEGPKIGEDGDIVEPPPKPKDDVARSASFFGAIMLLFWLLDGQQIFNVQPKAYGRDFFIFLMIVVGVYSWGSKKDSKRPGYLSREQTEEWKGWMQIVFLLYHYFAAKELYNLIRMLIAGYVWMTGYGNFSYFMKTKDYSLWRLFKMLFRLNFLVVMILMTMNTDWMLYYICPMHTWWFLSCYIMMCIAPSYNESTKGLVCKFAIYAAVVFVVWDLPGMCEKVWKPLGFILKTDNSMHEWVFRSGLDHWATFAGMLCAWAYPHVKKFWEDLEVEDEQKANYMKGGLLVPMAVAMFFWYNDVFLQDKYAYNAVHTYWSWLPIVIYIFVRNITPKMRTWNLWYLEMCGKITLETYLCQYHIWMARHDDIHVAAVITVVKGYPLVNFLINTVAYVFVAQQLFDMTTVFSTFLIPRLGSTDEEKAATYAVIKWRWLAVSATFGVTLALVWIVREL